MRSAADLEANFKLNSIPEVKELRQQVGERLLRGVERGHPWVELRVEYQTVEDLLEAEDLQVDPKVDQKDHQVDLQVGRQDNQDRVLVFGRNQDIDGVEVLLDVVVGHPDVEDPFGQAVEAYTVHNQAGLMAGSLGNAVAVVAGNFLQVVVDHTDHAEVGDSFDLVVDIHPEDTLVGVQGVPENLAAVVQNILDIGCNLDKEDNLG